MMLGESGRLPLSTLNLRVVYSPLEQCGRANARVLDHDYVLKLLHSRVKSAGSQIAFSRLLDVSCR